MCTPLHQGWGFLTGQAQTHSLPAFLDDPTPILNSSGLQEQMLKWSWEY